MSTATAAAWRVRHEGSPKTIDNLTLQEVAEGLQDALWEPTDEVLGPDDADWVAIENHPLLEEIAADIEPPPPRIYDDESRLDMNALIDVCLVLLVFFILTTSYAALSKRMDLPDVTKADPSQMKVVPVKEAEQTMIHVQIKMEDGKVVYRVEKQVIEPEKLAGDLYRRVGQTQKSTMLLEHDADVPHGAVVKAQDAASGARMQKVFVVVPDK